MPTDNCTQECIAYERLPASLPMAFVSGDDFPFRVVVNRDLASYTYAATITNAATGVVVATFAITSAPVTVAGATHTRITLTLTDTQTAALAPPTAYRWSLRWTSPAGDTRTALSGRVRVVKR